MSGGSTVAHANNFKKIDGQLAHLRDQLRKLLRARRPKVEQIVLKYRAICKMAAKGTVEALVGEELLPKLRAILATPRGRELLLRR